MNEVYWFKNLCTEKYCPIKFYLLGGFLMVMPRVEPLTDEEFDYLIEINFLDKGNYYLPVEYKKDSFGKLNGKFVAVDCGD